MDLARELKEHAPARVVVVDGEGERREVKVTAKRRKWEAITSLVEKLDASPAGVASVEMLDREGHTINVWVPEEPAGPDILKDAPPDVRRAEAINELVQRACDVAVKRQLEGIVTLLRGYQELTQIQSERLVALERSQGDMLDLARRAATVMQQSQERGSADDDATAMLKPVLQMAMSSMAAKPAGAK